MKKKDPAINTAPPNTAEHAQSLTKARDLFIHYGHSVRDIAAECALPESLVKDTAFSEDWKSQCKQWLDARDRALEDNMMGEVQQRRKQMRVIDIANDWLDNNAEGFDSLRDWLLAMKLMGDIVKFTPSVRAVLTPYQKVCTDLEERRVAIAEKAEERAEHAEEPPKVDWTPEWWDYAQ